MLVPAQGRETMAAFPEIRPHIPAIPADGYDEAYGVGGECSKRLRFFYANLMARD